MIAEWRRRHRLRRRIAEEIAGHIEESAQRLQATGLSRREALREAKLEFGDQAQITHECLLALDESPAPARGPLAGLTPAVWAALAIATPIALAQLLIPHHLAPLPGSAPEELVISRRRALAAYSSATKAPQEVAAFQRSLRTVSASGGDGLIRSGLSVSANFFELQGAEPALGNTFSGDEQEIVLSDGLWRAELGADPAAPGRTVHVDGVDYRVAGVMPRGYWFLAPGHRFWICVPRAEQDVTWGSLLARRRDDESLRDTKERVAAKSMIGLHDNSFVSLERSARSRLHAGLGVAEGSLWLLTLLGAVQVWSLVRSQCERRPSVALLLRYYAFLFAKAAPVIACLTIVWLAACDARVTLSGYFGDVWAFLTTFLFALLSVATAWQSLVDQRLRCPICLRRLAMPLPTGVIGSVLFDSAATEYICTHGHGSLQVPHPALEQLKPPAWREPEPWCLELWGPALRG